MCRCTKHLDLVFHYVCISWSTQDQWRNRYCFLLAILPLPLLFFLSFLPFPFSLYRISSLSFFPILSFLPLFSPFQDQWRNRYGLFVCLFVCFVVVCLFVLLFFFSHFPFSLFSFFPPSPLPFLSSLSFFPLPFLSPFLIPLLTLLPLSPSSSLPLECLLATDVEDS